MSKLLKPRYEYYKGTTEVIDNKLDNFVKDVVYRLNSQDFYKRKLLKEKQNQDKRIINLQRRLDVAEKKAELACKEIYVNGNISICNYCSYNIQAECPNECPQYAEVLEKYFQEQAEKELKGE